MARESDISRRSALKLVGGTVAASSISGLVAGDDDSRQNGGTVRVNVGYTARSGRQAATDRAEEIYHDLASFSSTGPEIEIAAPGADVYSTYLGGGYQTLSGTSMACPHVSGGAAQLAANGYTASEIRQQLKDTADDVGLSAHEQGAGRLDVADALGL